MSALPWFKCYPQAFREGMVGLTAEERGAYVTILMLIYERAAPIPDDSAWLAGHLWCSVKAWNKLRATLVAKGKIYAVEHAGTACLMNRRADEEIAQTSGIRAARKLSGKEGGKRSASQRAAVSNENNDLGQASASDLVKQNPSKCSSKIQPDNKSIRGSVSISNEIATGDDASPNARAWGQATAVLVAHGRMTPEGAKAFFGKLLSTHGLQASELLAALGEAEHTATRDPQALLTRWAQSRSRKAPKVQKRVGFV